MPSLTHSESLQRAATIHSVEYDIDLTLTEGETYRCRTEIRFDAETAGSSTFIELANPQRVTALLNGQPVTWTDGRIQLVDLRASNVLTVDAQMPCVTTGDGMHRFVDPADGATYIAAYCGMDIASRVFPCFDQPDLKAPIRLTVQAPEDWTVVANGIGDRSGGRWEFSPTPPISSYLFVVCAGPWASVTWEHAGLPFGWHARASLRNALERDAAELRQITVDCFDHYARVFDEPYPFDSYDQIMVPGQNWGALETPGAVTYRDEYLVPGEPTLIQREDRATTIAHEMAHMWFGNLVTMRWWEDTWLNESFADFMGYDVAGVAAGFPNSWTLCALGRKPTGYAADERRSTHPIAEDASAVVDVDWAFANFDMITYAKGNSVLRQLGVWMGEEAFLAGTNAHLSSHRFGTATLEDFLGAMDSVSDRDVRGWADRWLRSTGFDTIRVEREQGGVPVLHRDGSRPHRFSVAVLDQSGRVEETRMIDLDDRPVRLDDWAGRAVVPNAGDETFARILPDQQSWASITDSLNAVEPTLTRAMLWMTAVSLCRHGEMTPAALADLVGRHLPTESNELIREAVVRVVHQLATSARVAPEDLRPLETKLAATCRAIERQPGADAPAVGITRTLAACSADLDELRALLSGSGGGTTELDQTTRWIVIRRLAELGADPDAALIDAEAERDPSGDGHLRALEARAARPSAAAKAEAWKLLIDSEPSNREWDALIAGLWKAGQQELTEPYVAHYFEVAVGIAEARGQAYSRLVGSSVPSQAQTLPALVDVRGRLATALEAESVPSVLRRAWNDQLDDLDLAITARG